jgi:DNA modification methylase
MVGTRLADSAASVLEQFTGLTPDPEWAFAHLTQAQTSYATHGYHRYPAKFIPQLAARLIEDYSHPGDTVLDPFMGSGTALVEAETTEPTERRGGHQSRGAPNRHCEGARP